MSAAPSLGIQSAAAKAGLGKSVVVKGHLLSGEDLAIDGEAEGTIEVLEHRLTIGATGSVRADVNAPGWSSTHPLYTALAAHF